MCQALCLSQVDGLPVFPVSPGSPVVENEVEVEVEAEVEVEVEVVVVGPGTSTMARQLEKIKQTIITESNKILLQ